MKIGVRHFVIGWAMYLFLLLNLFLPNYGIAGFRIEANPGIRIITLLAICAFPWFLGWIGLKLQRRVTQIVLTSIAAIFAIPSALAGAHMLRHDLWRYLERRNDIYFEKISEIAAHSSAIRVYRRHSAGTIHIFTIRQERQLPVGMLVRNLVSNEYGEFELAVAILDPMTIEFRGDTGGKSKKIHVAPSAVFGRLK